MDVFIMKLKVSHSTLHLPIYVPLKALTFLKWGRTPIQIIIQF